MTAIDKAKRHAANLFFALGQGKRTVTVRTEAGSPLLHVVKEPNEGALRTVVTGHGYADAAVLDAEGALVATFTQDREVFENGFHVTGADGRALAVLKGDRGATEFTLEDPEGAQLASFRDTRKMAQRMVSNVDRYELKTARTEEGTLAVAAVIVVDLVFHEGSASF